MEEARQMIPICNIHFRIIQDLERADSEVKCTKVVEQQAIEICMKDRKRSTNIFLILCIPMVFLSTVLNSLIVISLILVSLAHIVIKSRGSVAVLKTTLIRFMIDELKVMAADMITIAGNGDIARQTFQIRITFVGQEMVLEIWLATAKKVASIKSIADAMIMIEVKQTHRESQILKEHHRHKIYDRTYKTKIAKKDEEKKEVGVVEVFHLQVVISTLIHQV